MSQECPRRPRIISRPTHSSQGRAGRGSAPGADPGHGGRRRRPGEGRPSGGPGPTPARTPNPARSGGPARDPLLCGETRIRATTWPPTRARRSVPPARHDPPGPSAGHGLGSTDRHDGAIPARPGQPRPSADEVAGLASTGSLLGLGLRPGPAGAPRPTILPGAVACGPRPMTAGEARRSASSRPRPLGPLLERGQVGLRPPVSGRRRRAFNARGRLRPFYFTLPSPFVGHRRHCRVGHG
jgi:hypothetical protein